MADLGLVLFSANLWKTKDTPVRAAPASIRDCVADADAPDRPVSVDVFFATYNKDPNSSASISGTRSTSAIRTPSTEMVPLSWTASRLGYAWLMS